MNTDRLILEALQKGAIEAIEQSIDPTFPIKILGRTFEIPNDHRYLETVFIPNNVNNEVWGQERTFRGIFRLIVHWGLDDAGMYPPMDLTVSIASHFVKGKSFPNGPVSVRIYEQPDLTGAIEAPPEMLFPVSIRYEFFKT